MLDLGAPARYIRRVFRDPRRLSQLHYSNVLSTLHLFLEPDDRGVLGAFFDVSAARFAALERDLLGDTAFQRMLEARHRAVRGRALRLFGRTSAEDETPRNRLLYYVLRLARPSVVVETGVFDGLGSAFVLKALSDNGHGHLYSVDLAARAAVAASTNRMLFQTLPRGQDPGWLIPEPLRTRWTLRLGRSKDVLPRWLAELGRIDCFIHDSIHTRGHMAWEFETAWQALGPGGLLASDDVFWNTAFWRFCRRHGVRGHVARGVGLVRKKWAPLPKVFHGSGRSAQQW